MASLRDPGLWFRGLDLGERLSLLRCGSLPPSDATKAERRILAWRELPAFRSAADFDALLNAFNATEPQFALAASADAHCLGTNWDVPTWASEIADLYAGSPQTPADSDFLGDDFFGFVAPLSACYRGRLLREVNKFNEPRRSRVASNVVSSLAALLDEQLLSLVTRPLLLELNIERIRGTLEGATPEQRYKSYVERLKLPNFRLQLWREYPGMARHANRLCGQWLNASLEFLSRFLDDSELLSEAFKVGDCSLQDAHFLGSESHDDGRRVIVATLVAGRRIVYKPRSLAAAQHFQDLLLWLNTSGQEPELRAVTVLDRGTYGWMEYVSAENCRNSAELQRFYQRQGALLAVAYLVGAIDCHFENVVACGEHPIIVDLETIFQPRLRFDNESSPVDAAARDALMDSVLASGLLPTPSSVDGNIVDLSGLGAGSFQDTPLETLGVVAAGTDTARVERVPYRLERTENRPVLNGVETSALDHLSDIVEGFNSTYDLILRRRSGLASKTGPIESFMDDPIRVLVRPTAAYCDILAQSLHPNALYDANERDRVLSMLWAAGDAEVLGSALYVAEYEQMLLGDVPFFKSTPRAERIYSHNASPPLFQVAATGEALLRKRLARMGEADRKLQSSLIHASVISLGPPTARSGSNKLPVRVERRDALAAAKRIGEFLAETAFAVGPSVTWLSRRSIDDLSTDALPVGLVPTTLYDGLAGIALFLAYLAKCTDEKHFRDLSRGALSSVERRLRRELPALGIGAFDGLAGLIYVYAHVGALCKDSSLLEYAALLLPELDRRISDDTTYDMVSGGAGAILALLALHETLPKCGALNVAVRCANHLQTKLSNTQPGGAPTPRYERGASHGYAGIALSLAAIATVDRRPSERFSSSMLKFEAGLTADGRWTDPEDEHRESQATWCHGAPGIAMCRLGAFQYNKDGRQLPGIEAAMLEAEQSPRIPTEVYGLCHGELGIVDSLLLASQVLADSSRWHRSAAARVGAHLRIGQPSTEQIHTPGLMTGLAGTGYGLLRFAEPELVPSVLLLQAPR